MAINNIDNEIGGAEGLPWCRNKETACISKLMHYKINSTLLSANLTFLFFSFPSCSIA